jgi:hypothetical protein
VFSTTVFFLTSISHSPPKDFGEPRTAMVQGELSRAAGLIRAARPLAGSLFEADENHLGWTPSRPQPFQIGVVSISFFRDLQKFSLICAWEKCYNS